MASELFYETLGLENQDSPQQTINTIEADKLIKALNRVIGEATDE
jgi:hypothetical protein